MPTNNEAIAANRDEDAEDNTQAYAYGGWTVVESPPAAILVTAPEKIGKTIFAGSASGEIYLIGTERGREKTSLALFYPEKQIHYKSVAPDPEFTAPHIWFGAWRGSAEKLTHAIESLLSLPPATVIIDSASDLLGIAAATFNQQLNRGEDPIPPMMYGQVYPILDNWLGSLRSRHRVILTARMKDEYKDSKKTGDLTIDIWKGAPYLVDQVIRLHRDDRIGKRVAEIVGGVNELKMIIDPTIDKVLDPSARDASDYIKALNRFENGVAYLKSLGEKGVDESIPGTTAEAESRIQVMIERVREIHAARGGAPAAAPVPSGPLTAPQS